jgi:hypothetical protein
MNGTAFNHPCRQQTNICDPVAGECMRCHAAQGEACRQPSAQNKAVAVKFAEPKHTPGPWSFDTIAMETGDYGVSQRDLRISICHVHNAASFGDFVAGALKRGGGKFEQRDAHTQIANALLIAAAPDLLRELKHCVWLLRDLQPEPGLVQKQALAAIAKAEPTT